MGSFAEWSYESEDSLDSYFIINYANGSTIDRDMALYVNGVYQTDVNFVITGGWTTWENVLVPITFYEGDNVIRLVALTDEGGPNIDLFYFTSESISSGSCDLPVDCNGDRNGFAYLDECNTCVGGGTGMEACVRDCNGDLGGTAFIDNCNECAGGNTGLEPNTACIDCNGDLGGTAFIDDCGVCVDGNTNYSPCLSDIEEGFYKIRPVHSNLCIEEGSPITQENCENNISEVWELTLVGSEYYFRNYDSGLYFSFSGNTRGNQVENANQGVEIRIEEGNTVGSFHLVNPENLDLTTDVNGGRTSAGEYLLQWTRNGQENQDFYFESVPTDCNGVPYGEAEVDLCGVCSGGTTGSTPNSSCEQDCNGVYDGDARLDDCGICSGGTTDQEPCTNAIELEDLCVEDLQDITVESDFDGYSGIGYLNLSDNAVSSFSIQITSGRAQSIALGIRYSNGDNDDHPMEILVNGTLVINSISFLSTGSWESWATNHVVVDVADGDNIITFRSINGDGPNIDLLALYSDNVAWDTCLVTGLEDGFEDIVLKPNPFTDQVVITNFKGDYELLNLNGMTLSSGNCKNNCSIGSTLPQGVYLLKLKTEENILIRKLTKE